MNADYWDYATGSNTIPTQALTDGTVAGSAVFDGAEAGFPADPADVNLAGGLSAYGTMGQNGNVAEWQENAFDGSNNSSSEDRAIRGGFWAYPENALRASHSESFTLPGSSGAVGFRVASAPEPSSTVLMLGTGLMFLLKRRRARSF